MKEDILQLFKDRLMPAHLPYFEDGWSERIYWRRWGLRGALAGEIPPAEFFFSLLPGAARPAGAGDRLRAYLDKELRRRLEILDLRRGRRTLFGSEFGPLDPSSPASWAMLFRLLKQIVVDDQYRLSALLSGGDAVVLDVGANVGVFSAWAAHLAPRGKIWAFEPSKRTAEALARNLAGLPGASAVRAAVGDREGAAVLALHPSLDVANALSDSGMPAVADAAAEETVPLITLDAFSEKSRLARVDFIKIDAEGYERRILRGAANLIKRHAPVLAVSAYHHPGDAEAIKSLVQAIEPRYAVSRGRGAEEDLFFHVPKK